MWERGAGGKGQNVKFGGFRCSMNVPEEAEGRAGSRAEGLGGWSVSGSDWRDLGRCSHFASDLEVEQSCQGHM